MRAQAQPLFFVFTALVTILVVVIGYNGVTTFLSTADESKATFFVKKFSQDVLSTGSVDGNIKQVQYALPSWVEQVCIVGSPKPLPSSCSKENFPLIDASYPPENVFLFGQKTQAFEIPFIETEECQVVMFSNRRIPFIDAYRDWKNNSSKKYCFLELC